MRRRCCISGCSATPSEEIELIVRPMVEDGKEAIGSMGDDTPLAVLSSRRRLLPDFFRQRFAQVTNPPIDSLREQSVMSLRTVFGRRGRLLDETALDARMVMCESPILTLGQLEALHAQTANGRPVDVVDDLRRGGAAAGAMIDVPSRSDRRSNSWRATRLTPFAAAS